MPLKCNSSGDVLYRLAPVETKTAILRTMASPTCGSETTMQASYFSPDLRDRKLSQHVLTELLFWKRRLHTESRMRFDELGKQKKTIIQTPWLFLRVANVLETPDSRHIPVYLENCRRIPPRRTDTNRRPLRQIEPPVLTVEKTKTENNMSPSFWTEPQPSSHHVPAPRVLK